MVEGWYKGENKEEPEAGESGTWDYNWRKAAGQG